MRRIAVLDPVKVTITNYPEGKTEYFELPNNPQSPDAGTRKVPFTKYLYIDRSDFAEVPPPKFFRLKPGGEVRLMGAYIDKCEEILKDDNGKVKEILCSCDLETGAGNPVDGRKVKGTIHWLSRETAIDASVHLYDRLFTLENVFDIPENASIMDYVNKDSHTILSNAKLEPSLANAKQEEHFQFVRTGYFVKDTKNENSYNLTVGLKDSYKPQ